MISFKISVPGKVILFGEHSVVYNKTAIAASLNQRTSLEFHELPSDASSIFLQMPRIGLEIKLPVNQVRDKFFGAGAPKKDESDHDATLSYIREFVDALNNPVPQRRTSLECFVYAMLQISQTENFELVPFRIHLDTELSIGAGQGSSASFSVSLVTCFLRLAQLQKDPQASVKLSQQDLNKISDFALNCEKIMHGAPSGIDNTICTFGSIIEFQKGTLPKFIPVEESRKMKILLVDTKMGRSTKALVDKVRDLKTKYPQVFDSVLEAMDGVAKRAVELLQQMQTLPVKGDDRYKDAYKELSVLIDINQGLLVTCQVSHPSLDTICANAKNFGFSAKLTGAGGGGFAYILIPPDASETQVMLLHTELLCLGFSVSETNLGGSGVEIERLNK